MKRKLKQLTAIVAMIGGLFAQQATAGELYTETVIGVVALPVGTYGSITTADPSSGTLLAADISLNYTDVPGVIVADVGAHIVTHTVEFWFQTATLDDKDIYSAANATWYTGARGYALKLKSDGKLQLFVGNGNVGQGSATYTTTASPIVAGQWSHIAIAITNTTGTIGVDFFVNGDSIGSGTDSTTLTNVTYDNTQGATSIPSGLNGGVSLTHLNFLTGHTFAGIYVDDTALDAVSVIRNAKSSIGKVVQSINLDGNVDSFISIPDHNDFHTTAAGYNTRSETMSAMVWVKTTATDVTIFNKRNPAGGSKSGYVVKLDATGKVTLQYSGWQSDIVTSTATVNDDRWHHIAIMATGRVVKIFIDGVEDQSVDIDADDGTDNTMPIVLGAEQDGSQRFPGNLKDFRIYQAIAVGSGSSIAAEDVLKIMADSAGSYSMTNLNMLVRLALKEDLTNTGTLGTSQNGSTNGTVTYDNNFTYLAQQPITPVNVSLALATATSVTATWDVTEGRAIVGFNWQFATDSGFTTGVVTGTSDDPTLRTAIGTGLTEATEYFFRIQSYLETTDTNWVNSATSATTLTTTQPTNPTLSSTSLTTVKATWGITVGTGNDGFKWELWSDANTILVDSGTILDAGVRTVDIPAILASGTEYFFRILSYVGAVDEAWVDNTETLTTLAGPCFAALGLSDSGGDDYVDCGAITELQNTATATVELWYRHGGVNVSHAYFDSSSQEIVWTNGQIQLRHATRNQLEISVDGETALSVSGLINPLITGNAGTTASYHVAVVYNGNGETNADRLKLYVNGAVQTLTFDTSVIPATIPATTNLFTIGTSNQNCEMIVDEFRAWSSARTELQINSFCKAVLNNPTSILTLICYYNFDKVLGTNVPDLTFTGTRASMDYSGTVVGAGTDPLWQDSNAAGVNGVKIVDAPMVLTPVVGLEVVQDGTALTWTLENEVGVIEYQVVNAATGEIIQTIAANDSKVYSITLPEGLKAELVVVDNHGSQMYLPVNGTLVTTPYYLAKGWNLIAITGDNADISTLQTTAIGPLWAWNGATYERTVAPVATQAIWVNSPVATRVDVIAEKSEAKVSLATGWSLVGPTNNEVVPEAAMSVFSYNETYNAITDQDKVLIRGVGYWIFSL